MPYGFTSPGANAGDAILKFLMQREMENRQAMLDQAAVRESEQNNAIQERSMKLQEQAAASQETARQTAMREKQNTVGVRGMMADAMTQGPLTPDAAKTIGIMGFREGVAPPDDVQRMLEPDTRAQELADYEAKQMIDASIQPAQDRYRTVGGSIFDAESRSFMTPPERSGGQGGASAGRGTNVAGGEGEPSRYAQETAQRTIQAIDDVMPKISNMTAGAGSLMKMIPGSDAANVSADLSSVAANVAFNALQAMREASKTGGALGQVSERELDLLSAVEGSIRQNQSPENLKMNLQKIRESMTRFQMAARGSAEPMSSHSPAGRQKWGRDANGRPVRMQ
jgi:hypothetical protein